MIRDQLHIDEQGIGWRIVSALTFDDAERAIAQCKVSGSVAHTDTENGVTLAEVKRDVPVCTCTPAIGMRHSPYCPIFAYEVANDERAGRLAAPEWRRPKSHTLVVETPESLGILQPIKQLRGRLIVPGLPPFQMPTFDTDCKVVSEEHDKPRRFMSLSVEMKLTPASAKSLRKFARQLMGHERPPLIDVLPSWETDEHGEDREVWYGHMRIVRNRKRMRKLKRRGVLFMDLRAKTGRKHPDGYEGPRAWAWFTPRDDGDKYDTKNVQTPLTERTTHYQTLTSYGDVPAGTIDEFPPEGA